MISWNVRPPLDNLDKIPISLTWPNCNQASHSHRPWDIDSSWATIRMQNSTFLTVLWRMGWPQGKRLSDQPCKDDTCSLPFPHSVLSNLVYSFRQSKNLFLPDLWDICRSLDQSDLSNAVNPLLISSYFSSFFELNLSFPKSRFDFHLTALIK